MHALTIRGADTGAQLTLEEVAEPAPTSQDLLVEGLALGVCGTDRSIIARGVRRSAPGRDWLILGHESLGRVLHAPPGSAYSPGDLVTGLVRRPDPQPCANCAAGDLDLCENGEYTERGILGQDGYGAQRYLLDPAYAVRVDPVLGLAGVLVEPTSIVAKAWERLDVAARRPGGRALVLGAGPIGLLAALLAHQRGYDVHVVDQVADGPKVAQVRALPATYHQGVESLAGEFDAVLECTGELVAAAVTRTARGGALCLVAGLHRGAEVGTVDLAAVSGALMGGNRTFTGVVSSSRQHFEAAHSALRTAAPDWLSGLMTTVVPLAKYAEAFAPDPHAIKTVIRLTDAAV
ncbi:alcohol dehydrogenase catalytic domain-containing protein [Actinopolymorpha pittospori]|uniref:Threonine dehydrogenase-like Zn-dependent dehydrogenase n=1 Tax=Actinopolymorpha pittospori TaxID=648752 RepID=A0A927N5U2_9ACTN|nr:alcohol dehydrogenase catalytic domain-containing protein [Actinopolymorpha pittospori]MBE1612217.1 threonine dehydrogenase-like Zn-dependent dehydrogenase [Actinopolymorpha pittospori]